MNRENDGSNAIAVFVVIGFLLLIGWMMEDSTEECMKIGCTNDQAPNSSYCYTHKSNKGYSSYKSKSSNTSTSTSGSSSTKKTNNTSGTSNSVNSTSSTKSYGTSQKNNSNNSYGDGYDAIYNGDSYDDDRYYNDPDYADGVNDAMDEQEWITRHNKDY